MKKTLLLQILVFVLFSGVRISARAPNVNSPAFQVNLMYDSPEWFLEEIDNFSRSL